MKRLSRFAVNNKGAMIFSALFLSIIGFYLIFQIPQGVFPDATFPRIAVLVDYGMAPLKEMEMEIVKPIEEASMMVEGVKLVRSSISRGSGEINIDFQWDQDMFRAYQLVQAQISGIQNQLPKGVTLEVRRFTTSTYPVAGFSLTSDKQSLLQLRDLAVYTIRPQLASIPGVFNIEVMGGKEREYSVNLDPAKLALYNIDYRDIKDALIQSNNLQSVGRLEESNKLYLNIADNRFVNIADIKNSIVKQDSNTPIFLKDIADVEPALKETFIACESDLKPAVLITVIKQSGTNAVEIMDKVEERLAELQSSIPTNVKISKWYDMTDFIKSSIGSVRDAIFFGAILTFIILFLFLKRIRITLVTIIIIPVALLISFVFMKLFGITLNLMSLGGLAAAIGILVDNAIVVIENIERYLEEGHSGEEAIVDATSEIISPLLGATLTTLVVFVPLIFLTGVPGIFFRALASTLSIAIFVSMLLAVFITPALAVLFISKKEKKHGKVIPQLVKVQQKSFRILIKTPSLIFLIILLLAGIAYYSYDKIPSGFLPEWDEGTIIHDYLAPAGSSIKGTKSMLKSISEYIMTIPEVETYSLRTGRSLAHPRTHTNDGDFVISLKKDRTRSAFEIMDELRKFDEQNEPRLEPKLFQVLPDRLNDLSGEIAPIVIKVFGKNLSVIQNVATEISDSLENVDGAVDVFKGFESGEPELSFTVKPEAAKRFGLTIAEVNRTLKMALWGEDSGKMLDGLKVIPIKIRYHKNDLNRFEKIKMMPIYIASIDRMLQLDEIVDVKKSPGKSDIEHENLSQVVNIEAQIANRDLGSTIKDVQLMLDRVSLPPGVTVQIAGQYESQQQAFDELLLILSFGILLVFTILLFEFKSFRTSLVILIGTILSVSGVFLILWLVSIPLDISAFMGMIMIIGVVVNNGILMIDYAEKYLEKNKNVTEALLMAGKVRLRPILMTTLATIFGFLPLALAYGEGAEMLQPLAISMIGGMSISMLLSLLIIPGLYWMVNKR